MHINMERYSFNRAQNEANIIKEKASKLHSEAGSTGGPDSGDYTEANQLLSRTESMYHMNQDVSFEKILSQKVHYDTIPLEKIKERSALFNEYGINVDPHCIDNYDNLKRFDERDWKSIRESKIPTITLLAANHYYSMLKHFEFYREQGNYSRQHDLFINSSLEAEARLRSLPLIHGTSVEALEKMIEQGKLISNKQLYKESDVDVFTFQDSRKGMTMSADRELGLDQYVFADFGRPHMFHNDQQEVTLVIDPSAMKSPGVFMTEHDIADCTLAKNPVESYLAGVATPEYFYEVSKMRVADTEIDSREVAVGRGVYKYQTTYNTIWEFMDGMDGDLDQKGKPNFSTWEVKLPEVEPSTIKRIVVRDKDKFNYLSKKYSGSFDIVYEPKLRPTNRRETGNYDILRIPGEFEKQFEILVDDDYNERVTELGKLSENEKEVVFVVFPRTEIDGGSIARNITEKTNPFTYPTNVFVYNDFNDIATEIRSVDVRSDSRLTSEWCRDFLDGQIIKDECTVCKFERSKANHNIGRIIDMQEFIPSELAI